jgi:hypothetical protein
MGEWIAIEQWQRCVELARPGIVFEIRNTSGNSMFTECVTPLPAAPFDWQTPPVAFRAVPETPPPHSDPLPPPKS